MKAVLLAEDLKRVVDNTKRFCAKENSQNHLMGYIYLKIDAVSKIITATALDGHRIAMECAELKDCDQSFSGYIRSKIPPISGIELEMLELLENRIYVTVGENIMGYVQPDGYYYNVKELFAKYEEKEVAARVAVNAAFLKDAMSSIGPHGRGRAVAEIEIRGELDPVIIKDNCGNKKIILPIQRRI